MRILLLTLSLSGTLTLYAQVDLTKRISIDVKHVRLDKLFEMLETRHGVIISFGIDNLPSNLTISLSANDKSIYEILQMICTQSGLIYQIIDNAIVFKHARPTNVSRTERASDSNSIPFTPNRDSTIHSPVESVTEVILNESSTPHSVDSLSILYNPHLKQNLKKPTTLHFKLSTNSSRLNSLRFLHYFQRLKKDHGLGCMVQVYFSVTPWIITVFIS